MPKVTYPLLSGDARGRFGRDLIYYSQGYVRSWSQQVDPRTAEQVRFRTVVRVLMQTVKAANGLDRAWLRRNFAQSWHTRLVSWVTANKLARYDDLLATWGAMDAQARAEWEAQVPAGG